MKPILKRYPDGSCGKVKPDGSWEFKLANGLKHSGQCSTEEEALAAIEKLHRNFVMDRWKQGRPSPGGMYLVRLR